MPTKRAPTKGKAHGRKAFAKSAATRQRILEAAATELMENGAAATRLGDIAERANMQAGSLYYHFDSREDLIEEVLRYGVRWTHEQVVSALQQAPADLTPMERVGVAIRAHLEAMLSIGDLAPVHNRLFVQVSPEMQKRVRKLRRDYGDVWTELVTDAIAAGELRDDVDRYIIQSFIVNTLDYLPYWRLKTKQSPREMSEILRSLFLDGLGPSASGKLNANGASSGSASRDGDTVGATSP